MKFNDIFSMQYSSTVKKPVSLTDLIQKNKKEIIALIWKENTDIKKILTEPADIIAIRKAFLSYLNNLENELFHVYSNSNIREMPASRKEVAKESIRIVKNIIRTENEQLTGFSALKKLIQLASYNEYAEKKVQKGFLIEFLYLFRSIKGHPTLLESEVQASNNDPSSENYIQQRSEELDLYSNTVMTNTARYRTGFDKELIESREALRQKILKYWNAGDNDWNNFQWHIEHIVEDLKTLSDLVDLENDEFKGLQAAERYNIPFQITPYYLSLFNERGRCDWDRAIRAQVIPSTYYCQQVYESHLKGGDMDFMGEKWTSPIEAITRRYPQILILKPFDSCPQICVYCQRNWEIKKVKQAYVAPEKIRNAIEWIRSNPAITEVLVTGGDPLHLENDYLDKLLGELCNIEHIKRIRLGTRILVTIPQRIDAGFINILEKYHRPGQREICIMTHFEHSSEMARESLKAVQKIRRLGISVYNQQVFTYYNSRRFETALLRKTIKICGIDPYYTFNTKGKEETMDFRVPIARLEQERNEEARLLPGVERTDEPVFNVPRIGKSHLRAWQNHEPIMILASGERVYRFYPWESRLKTSEDYVYTDVSIYDYLYRLFKDGEDPDTYQSIWYYY